MNPAVIQMEEAIQLNHVAANASRERALEFVYAPGGVWRDGVTGWRIMFKDLAEGTSTLMPSGFLGTQSEFSARALDL